MGLFSNNKIKKGAVADIIQCTQKDYLVWKWAPDGEDGNGLRADSIRYGSMLNVDPGETAVLFYHQGNGSGKNMEFIKGPVRSFKIETANLPVLSSIIGAGYGGGSPFSASVYFVNTATANQFMFFLEGCAVQDFQNPDEKFSINVKGKATFRIADCERFFTAHNLEYADTISLKETIKETLIGTMKPIINRSSLVLGIPAKFLDSYSDKIRDLAFRDVQECLDHDFAVALERLDIVSIEYDEEVQAAYRTGATNTAWARTASATTNRVNAENMIIAAKLEREKMIRSQQISLDHLEDGLARQREVAQRTGTLQAETANLAAHQLDVQGSVGITAAESLGQLGASGGASIGGDGGMNVAGMMAGIMMGGAVGQNMANMMGNMTGNMSQPTPPPPPPGAIIQFFVAMNGQQSGPYNMAQMNNLINSRQVTRQTYVWKQGMANWEMAGNVPELAQAFSMVPPPLPNGMPPVPPAL